MYTLIRANRESSSSNSVAQRGKSITGTLWFVIYTPMMMMKKGF
jgi:hypothetical protein